MIGAVCKQVFQSYRLAICFFMTIRLMNQIGEGKRLRNINHTSLQTAGNIAIVFILYFRLCIAITIDLLLTCLSSALGSSARSLSLFSALMILLWFMHLRFGTKMLNSFSGGIACGFPHIIIYNSGWIQKLLPKITSDSHRYSLTILPCSFEWTSLLV